MQQTAFFQEHVPPRLEDVTNYFTDKNMNAKEAEHFYLFYEMKQWTSKAGNFITNWKSLAYRWIMSALRH